MINTLNSIVDMLPSFTAVGVWYMYTLGKFCTLKSHCRKLEAGVSARLACRVGDLRGSESDQPQAKAAVFFLIIIQQDE